MPGQWGIQLFLHNYSFIFDHFSFQCSFCCPTHTIFLGCIINYRFSRAHIVEWAVNINSSLPDLRFFSISLCSARKRRKGIYNE